MHRLDPQLIDLDEQMASAASDSTLSDIKNREKMLAPLYTQIAHEFADLHDRAGRMKAKGCITEVLEWRTAREYFYWRIRRRQAEEAIKDRLVAASNGGLTLETATARLAAAVPAMDDQAMVAWMEKNGPAVEQLVSATKKDFAAAAVKNVLKDLSAADVEAILNLVKK